MDKKQLITTLNSCLFSFEGSSEAEIINLNPDYNLNCVKAGIQLSNYLKGVQIQ